MAAVAAVGGAAVGGVVGSETSASTHATRGGALNDQ